MSERILLVAVGDTHGNSRQALFPPGVTDEEGMGRELYDSPVRKRMWECWCETFVLARQRADQQGAKLAVIFMGDMADKNLRDATGIVFQAPAIQMRLVKAMLRPVVEARPDLTIVIRGTMNHVGTHGELEEMGAEWLSEQGLYVAKDPVNKTFSWWDFAGELGGVRVHAEHHPKTYGFMPWTEQAAAARESSYIAWNCDKHGMARPDLALRGHVHYPADSGIESTPRVLFTPAWTFTSTTYGHRKGLSLAIRWFGAYFILCHEGQAEVEPVRWLPERRQYWTADWDSATKS